MAETNARKTLPSDGTDKLFIGCCIVMFSRANGYQPRYDCNREVLLNIVMAAKVKVGNNNLLSFYLDRINTKKNVKKYFGKVLKKQNLDQYADIIIDYLEQFKPNFIGFLQKYENKIKEYESFG